MAGGMMEHAYRAFAQQGVDEGGETRLSNCCRTTAFCIDLTPQPATAFP